MSTHLTNLLPPERVSAVRRAHLARLSVIGLLLLTLLAGVGAALLVPAHNALRESIASNSAHLAFLQNAARPTAGASLSARF